MNYVFTQQQQFLDSLNEGIDYDKISSLKERIKSLNKRYYAEKDQQKRKRLAMEIKVCELKIEIEKIV